MSRAGELLKGAYDLHVHAGPDVVRRKMDDMELAQSYINAGMKGFLIKAHYFSTEGRAYHVRKAFPGFRAFGSVVLNNSMGGLNPYAVRQCALLGTKFLFMPTMDAQNMWDYLEASGAEIPFGANAKSYAEVKGIRIARDGALVPEVEEILDIAAKYGMILCSGHVSPAEGMSLYRRAAEKGIVKMLATHVEWPATRYSLDQQKELASLGVLLEHNVANIMSGDLPVDEFVRQVHEIGAEHFVLDTDLGQNVNPVPVEAFEEYVQKLLDAGITEDEMRLMISLNPERITG